MAEVYCALVTCSNPGKLPYRTCESGLGVYRDDALGLSYFSSLMLTLFASTLKEGGSIGKPRNHCSD